MISVNKYGEIQISFEHLKDVEVKSRALVYLDAPYLVIQFTHTREPMATSVNYTATGITMFDTCATYLFIKTGQLTIKRKTHNKLYLQR